MCIILFLNLYYSKSSQQAHHALCLFRLLLLMLYTDYSISTCLLSCNNSLVIYLFLLCLMLFALFCFYVVYLQNRNNLQLLALVYKYTVKMCVVNYRLLVTVVLLMFLFLAFFSMFIIVRSLNHLHLFVCIALCMLYINLNICCMYLACVLLFLVLRILENICLYLLCFFFSHIASTRP